MTPLRLRKPVEDAIRRGHPWIFHDALPPDSADGEDGEVVTILDRRGDFLARGSLEPRSPLRVRVWTLDPDERLDDALLDRRLAQALALRRVVVPPHITGYRLCNGENDHLPGLQCDLYDGVASLRTDGALGAAWEERFVAAVRRAVDPAAVVVRNPKVQKNRARLVFGDLPDELGFTEGPADAPRRFEVDVLRGMKTGFFLDQRENRDLVGRIAAGRRVLNLFSYTGGFSVAAALGSSDAVGRAAGAERTVSVDQSAPAIEAARRNFARNSLDPAAHEFHAGDAFAYLEDHAAAPGRFDLIVCDPPSFAPNRRAVRKAEQAYLRLNRLALTALAPGGLLATASCSSHIREADFESLVTRAAAEVGRPTVLVARRGAAACHPTRLGFPEGRYLNFLLLSVE